MADHREISSVGIMEGAFFVSRKELIEWINKTLKLNITKIEQCSNGAIYIQLLDMLFPTKSVLPKAKWLAKLEYECIMNYKLIQSVFSKFGIKKQIDVDKLIRGKYQDNLEFLQWFKAFYERIIDYNSENIINYDPVERRKISILGERGDYRLLNTYLPDWAKVDLSYIKDRGGTHHEIKETTGSGLIVSGGGSHTQRRALSRTSANMENSYINNVKSSTSGNNNIQNNACNRRIKTEKGAYSMHNKELNATKKTLNPSGTRISISNKYSSQDSSCSNFPRNHNNIDDSNTTIEFPKDVNALIEQNKKMKYQLECKNEEIESLQNKLKGKENAIKITKFQKEFYYNKLRFLELLCNQTDENYLLISDIQQIIYARENTYFHQTISLDKNEKLNETNNGQELPMEIEHSSCTYQNEFDNVEYASGEENLNGKEPEHETGALNGDVEEGKPFSGAYQINAEYECDTEKNIDYSSNCT